MQISTIPSTIIRKELSRKVPSRRANRRSPHYHNKILFILCPPRPSAKCSKKEKTFHFVEIWRDFSLRNLKRTSATSASWRKSGENSFEIDAIPLFRKHLQFNLFSITKENAVKKSSETCRRASGAHSSRDFCGKWNWNSARQTEQRNSLRKRRVIYGVQFIIIPAHYTNLCETLTPSFPTRNYRSWWESLSSP